MTKRVCITGAAGFIGSHVTERLLAKGIEVVGLDNFSDFYDPIIKRRNLIKALKSKRFALIEGDLRDPETVRAACEGTDAVIHLAAMVGVRASFENPRLYQQVNVGGTLNVCESCREAGVPTVIMGSSSSVYGDNKKVPFSEDDPVDHPISIYAATKKACELICHAYHAAFGMDVTCLRFFTVYGPRQRPDLAIHKFCDLALAGKPVPVFGDGSMERDYTYVDDIVSGVEAALESAPGKGYRLFNIGSDRPLSLGDLILAIERALGVKIEIERKPVPPGDVRRTWADLTRARSELGYQPRTSIEDGLTNFVSWLKLP